MGKLLEDSKKRCGADNQFVSSFYANLFSEYPELMRYFAKVDYEKQYKMLCTALERLTAVDEMTDEDFDFWMFVSSKHQDLMLDDSHFYKWKTIFIKHVEERDKMACATTLEEWENHLEQMINLMKIAYDPTSGIKGKSEL